MYIPLVLCCFKLFVRKPCEADCRIASSYSFEKMRYGSEKYQPKLYKMLDLFLKKTLSIATAPRWHEMQKVIDALDELIKLADINDVYLLDSFQYNSACFVGRQDDLEEINELLAKESACIPFRNWRNWQDRTCKTVCIPAPGAV